MAKRKALKLPNEKLVVFITAPTILGTGIYKAYAHKITAPSRDGKRLMSLDVEGKIDIHDIAALGVQRQRKAAAHD